mgnify:CR=1 FL=1
MEKTKMYDYICETPVVLREIIENRKEITKEFVEYFKDKNIEQIYVLGSGTSYHAGLSAKNYLEELLNRNRDKLLEKGRTLAAENGVRLQLCDVSARKF